MDEMTREQAARREKTLLTALLLSAPGPIFTGMAVLSSQSTTQIADFLRRGMDLVALFLSWWVFRQLQRRASLSQGERSRLERLAGLTVAAAMFVSGIVMLALAISRLPSYEPGGQVTLGLVIAVLGLLTNSWFWRRYTTMTREKYSSVIAAQMKLYRAKAMVDLCVVAALTSIAIAPAHPVTGYVDIVGSIIVAVYLLASGAQAAGTHLGSPRAWLQRIFGRDLPAYAPPVEKKQD